MALHPKVTAGVVAGALVSLIIAEAKRRGVPIEADEASGITVLLTFLAGFFVPGNGSDAGAGSVSVAQIAAAGVPPAAVNPQVRSPVVALQPTTFWPAG